MPNKKDTWICTHCKWEGHLNDIIKHETFVATQEEPSEWIWYCPECKRSDSLNDLYENANWCIGCEEIMVKDDGTYCAECIVCEAEERAENWADLAKQD